ncbi:hypothetical protein AB3N02_13925 [Priestia aryabhattai]|uniref:hypothetical protein n=1 Tax=Priestia aryabhattai TaxID=412384 RepID=UPI0039A1779A
MCELKTTLNMVKVAAQNNPSVLEAVVNLLARLESADAPNTSAYVKNNITTSNTLNSLNVICFNCELTNELTLKGTVSYRCRHCDWKNNLSPMQMKYMKTL